jgi:hypothetical protein
MASTTQSTGADSAFPPPSVHLWDVIIIGAGQAGMAAAHRLLLERPSQEEDIDSAGGTATPSPPPKVLILEASSHVGGRTRNYDVVTGQWDVATDDIIELGGTWFSPNHTAALELCHKLSLEVYHASFQENNKEIPSTTKKSSDKRHKIGKAQVTTENRQDDADVEFPWWFWGADYNDDEMKRIRKIVLHRHNHQKPVTFSTPKEFLHHFDSQTRQELEMVGKIIQQDCAMLADDQEGPENTKKINVWELPNVGQHWPELDAGSTARERSFLFSSTADTTAPILTKQDGRNILRGILHGMNCADPET